MIISDLIYWEAVELETNIVGGMTLVDKVDSFTFDKDVNLDVNIALDIKTEFDVTAWGQTRVTMRSEVNILGNFASATFDVTALGDNSVAEADVSLLVTDNLTEISGSLFAAVS